MSRPPFVHLPPRVRAYALSTGRGEFAVLDADPRPDAPGTPREGAAPLRGTVLLIPGYTGSKEDFIALLGPLTAAGYRAVAVDGRGQHETPGPDGRAGRCDYRIGALAQDVLAQAAALGDGPVHLVGHSLGGLISRGAVLHDPAAVRSLTLVSSGPGRLGAWPRWRLRALSRMMPVLGQDRLWGLLHPREAAHTRAVARQTEEADPVTAFLHGRWGGTRSAQLYTTGRQLRYEPDRVRQLAEAGVPVHVLRGERDGVWPVRWMDTMAVRLSARRTVISGAGHSPNTDRPAATAVALLDFFTGLDAAPTGAAPAPVRSAQEAPS